MNFFCIRNINKSNFFVNLNKSISAVCINYFRNVEFWFSDCKVAIKVHKCKVCWRIWTNSKVITIRAILTSQVIIFVCTKFSNNCCISIVCNFHKTWSCEIWKSFWCNDFLVSNWSISNNSFHWFIKVCCLIAVSILFNNNAIAIDVWRRVCHINLSKACWQCILRNWNLRVLNWNDFVCVFVCVCIETFKQHITCTNIRKWICVTIFLFNCWMERYPSCSINSHNVELIINFINENIVKNFNKTCWRTKFSASNVHCVCVTSNINSFVWKNIIVRYCDCKKWFTNILFNLSNNSGWFFNCVNLSLANNSSISVFNNCPNWSVSIPFKWEVFNDESIVSIELNYWSQECFALLWFIVWRNQWKNCSIWRVEFLTSSLIHNKEIVLWIWKLLILNYRKIWRA